jgi:DNA-binding LacI/PurR family transcriptional regulator
MVTIRDVAADAGVARSTVSYVLSGNKKLPEATRQKVLASVARLGYRPNPRARALALKRTNILGFLASIDLESREADIDVFMRFVRAAMYEARSRGYDLLMMGQGVDELGGDVLADALVVMDILHDDPRLPDLVKIGAPTVLIGQPGVNTTFSFVDLDFEQAGRIALTHLADLGHVEIAVLGPVPQAYDREFSFALRFRDGFLAACSERGVRGEVIPRADGPAGADAWLDEARQRLPNLSAIVAHGPGELEPFFETLQARGVSIPGDCSIVTVAPEAVMRHADRPLTAIDLPGDEMVRRAVRLALDEVAGLAEPGLRELLPAVLSDLGSTGRHIPGVSGTVFEPRSAATRV